MAVHVDVAEEAPFEVRSRTMATPHILALELVPGGPRIDFRPGQYVLLCDAQHRMPERSYSIANAPRADGSLRLLITRVPAGEISGWAHDELRTGRGVLISGPYGTFVRSAGAAAPELHLAAGSGLAPILALLEEGLRHAAPAHSTTLLFSARIEADVLMRDLLDRWQREHPNFTFLRTLTREIAPGLSGRIPTVLPMLFTDLSRHSVFIAGSDGFVESCRQAVLALGANRSRVLAEEFFFEPHHWRVLSS